MPYDPLGYVGRGRAGYHVPITGRGGINPNQEVLWSSIKSIATKFPRHSMDLFIMAQEKNATALKSIFAEIKRDVDDLERLMRELL